MPAGRFDRLTVGEQVAAVLPAVAVYAQMVFIGANTAFLSSLAALADIATAMVIFGLLAPATPRRFWGSLAWPAVLLLAAIAWASVGLLPLGRSDWASGYLQLTGDTSLSLTPDRTLLELSKLLGAGALALAAALVAASPRRLRVCVMTLLALGAAHTLVGLILFAIDPDTVAGLSKGAHRWRFTGTLLNGNAAASSMAMTGVLAAGYFRSAIRKLQQTPSGARTMAIVRLAAAGGLIFLLAGATALTTSRTALMAEVAGVFVVLFWPTGRAPRAGEPKAPKKGLVASLAGVLAALVCVALAVALTEGETLGRAAGLAGDFSLRMSAYEWIAGKSAQAPVFGYGLGSFAPVALNGLGFGLADVVWNLGAAHNALLQAVLEGGAPFAILLSLSILAALAPACLKGRTSPIFRAMRVRLFAALAVAAVCGSVDIALNVPAVAAQAVVLIGLLAGGARAGTGRPGPQSDAERLEPQAASAATT